MTYLSAHFCAGLSGLLFPRKCIYCGEIVLPKGRLLCPACEEKLPYITGKRCAKCGKELRKGAAGELCLDCEKHERSFSFSLCLFHYDGVSAEIMAGLKFRHKKETADPLAYLAYRRLGAAIRLIRPDALIPVPVHPGRRRERGYNQAEAICDSLCAFWNADEEALIRMGAGEELRTWCLRERENQYRAICSAVSEEEARNCFRPLRTEKQLLIRKKNTKALKKLSASQRLLNLQQAFAVNPDAVRGRDGAVKMPRTVLLVDDIYTTGATMEACTAALLSAGVETVCGFSVCAGRDV